MISRSNLYERALVPRSARQFWVQAPGQGEIVAAPLPPRQAGQALVRALYSGVSRGTESLVFRGEVPFSQRRAMRAPFQEGDFPGPVKYGYSSVGEVLEVPEEAPRSLLGSQVFCLYPHQDFYLVPVSALSPLPKGVPAARAVLAANMETAVNGFWDGAPSAGDRIVVIGAGVVGLLSAWLCARVPGVRVTVVDVDPSREPVARSLGLEFAATPPAEADADLVIHASGTPEGAAAALSAAGLEGTVLELSWYGSRPVQLPLGEAFHSRRLTLKSSQVGRIPASRAPRWSHGRRLALALELLADPTLDHLVSGESAFEELPQLMRRIAHDGRGVLCHRIRYP
jgi:threonine dehydrogenase-like Zn-dependent dehydrogenase